MTFSENDLHVYEEQKIINKRVLIKYNTSKIQPRNRIVQQQTNSSSPTENRNHLSSRRSLKPNHGKEHAI